MGPATRAQGRVLRDKKDDSGMNNKPEIRSEHYAVIFTAELSDDLEGYEDAARHIRALAAQQPGFLGVESVMEGHSEITVSYWESAEAIRAWKQHPQHLRNQQMGRSRWYRYYDVRICRVERVYAAAPQQENAH